MWNHSFFKLLPKIYTVVLQIPKKIKWTKLSRHDQVDYNIASKISFVFLECAHRMKKCIKCQVTITKKIRQGTCLRKLPTDVLLRLGRHCLVLLKVFHCFYLVILLEEISFTSRHPLCFFHFGDKLLFCNYQFLLWLMIVWLDCLWLPSMGKMWHAKRFLSFLTAIHVDSIK